MKHLKLIGFWLFKILFHVPFAYISGIIFLILHPLKFRKVVIEWKQYEAVIDGKDKYQELVKPLNRQEKRKLLKAVKH